MMPGFASRPVQIERRATSHCITSPVTTDGTIGPPENISAVLARLI
jgi:hypothetical protein